MTQNLRVMGFCNDDRFEVLIVFIYIYLSRLRKDVEGTALDLV